MCLLLLLLLLVLLLLLLLPPSCLLAAPAVLLLGRVAARGTADMMLFQVGMDLSSCERLPEAAMLIRGCRFRGSGASQATKEGTAAEKRAVRESGNTCVYSGRSQIGAVSRADFCEQLEHDYM